MDTIFSDTAGFAKTAEAREALARLGRRLEVVVPPSARESGGGRAVKARALLARARDIDVLVCALTPLGEDFFHAATRLRHIAVFGAGVDHVDMEAATARRVLVTNAPGANARSVAELVMGLVLSLARSIPAMHRGVCDGAWKRVVGRELHGRTMGIVGLGQIGQETARLASCFGMRLLACARRPDVEQAQRLGVRLESLERVLAAADVVSLHVPAAAGSPLIGAKELALMRPDACLVNTARGNLVDLDALHDALAGGRLAGAGLDVFPGEPVDGSHPIFRLPNLVATPHAGATTGEALERVSLVCLEEIERALRREPSPRACNPAVYAHWGN